jgi:hypothetical protein
MNLGLFNDVVSATDVTQHRMTWLDHHERYVNKDLEGDGSFQGTFPVTAGRA